MATIGEIRLSPLRLVVVGLFVITRVETFFQQVCNFGLHIEALAANYIIREYALVAVVLDCPTAYSQQFCNLLVGQETYVAEYRMMAIPNECNRVESLLCPVASLYYTRVIAVYNLVSHCRIIFALHRDARHSRQPPGKEI